MEEKNTSVFYNGLIWGVIIGLVSVIYSVLLYVFDQALNRTLGYLSLLILLGGLAYSMYYFRESVREGILSFGTAFGFGVVVVVTAGIIGQIYSYLLFTVIDPGLQDKMLEMAMDKMMEKGVPEDQIDQAMNITKKFMSPVFLAISGLVSTAIMGSILSVISAAIFKREAPEGAA